jgi:hypothetical protein
MTIKTKATVVTAGGQRGSRAVAIARQQQGGGGGQRGSRAVAIARRQQCKGGRITPRIDGVAVLSSSPPSLQCHLKTKEWQSSGSGGHRSNLI